MTPCSREAVQFGKPNRKRHRSRITVIQLIAGVNSKDIARPNRDHLRNC